MKKILIVGGGRQGSLVAKDFIDDRCQVTIADIRDPGIAGTKFIYFDAYSYQTIHEPKEESNLFRLFDLVVNTLPGDISFPVTRCIAHAGVKCVDLSFTHEDIFELDTIARQYGGIIVPDCGLAPGIPNYILGRWLAERDLDNVEIYVGGVASDRNAPYGYVVTWNPSDLKTEYLRPAKIVENGKITTRDPLEKPKKIFLQGDGDMEAFYSDGLRTLLKLDGIIPNLSEYTLRWPGHVKAVKELLNSDKDFVEELTAKCSSGWDKVILLIKGTAENFNEVLQMECHGSDEQSAMSKTTAHSCYATGRILLEGLFTDKGVHPPEHLGFHSHACFNRFRGILSSKGLRITTTSNLK